MGDREEVEGISKMGEMRIQPSYKCVSMKIYWIFTTEIRSETNA